MTARLKGAPVTRWHFKVASAVSCSYCRSNVGWPCTTANGRNSSTAHVARTDKYIDEFYLPWKCPKCGRTAKVNPEAPQIYCPCGTVSKAKQDG